MPVKTCANPSVCPHPVSAPNDPSLHSDISHGWECDAESDSDDSFLDQETHEYRGGVNEKDEVFMSVLDHIDVSSKSHEFKPAPVPARMTRANLLAHQLESLAWMQQQERNPSGPDDVAQLVAGIDTTKDTVKEVMNVSVRGGILADPTGSGKTRAVIALCESEREEPYDMVRGSRVLSRATLIVCRAAAIKEWVDEIRTTVSPTPRILVYCGRVTRCLSVRSIAEEYDYVLTSYHSLRYDLFDEMLPSGKLHMIHWLRLVIDDAHVVGKIQTQRSHAIMRLFADCRWLVTPFPFKRCADDAFAHFRFLRVPYFVSSRWWEKHIYAPSGEKVGENLLSSVLSKLLLLRGTVSSFPSMISETVEVELNEKEKALYEKTKKKAERVFIGAIHSNRKVLEIAPENILNCKHACLSYCIVAEAEKAHIIYDPAERLNQIDEFSEKLKKYLKTTAGKESFVTELMDHLREQKLGDRKCSICYESVLEPAILPCGHVYCKACIHASRSRNDKCPECKDSFSGGDLLEVPESLVESSIFDRSAIGDYNKWPPSSKMNALLERVTGIPQAEKIVIFCSSDTYIHYAHWLFETKGINSLVVSAATRRENSETLRRFSEDPTAHVLFLHLTHETPWTNVTMASHCFFMESHWSPFLEKNALSCFSRLGTPHREIKVVKFIAKNTIEKTLEEFASKKRGSGAYRFGVSSALSNLTDGEFDLLFPMLQPKQGPQGNANLNRNDFRNNEGNEEDELQNFDDDDENEDGNENEDDDDDDDDDDDNTDNDSRDSLQG